MTFWFKQIKVTNKMTTITLPAVSDFTTPFLKTELQAVKKQLYEMAKYENINQAYQLELARIRKIIEKELKKRTLKVE